jgi:hypothetical protein
MTGGHVATGGYYMSVDGGAYMTGGRVATGGHPAVDGGATGTGGAVYQTGGAWVDATGGNYWDTLGGAATGGAWEYGPGGNAWEATGGAFGLARVCTPGQDQTCNDNPMMSALAGHCETDQTCSCKSSYVLNPNTYKCNTYDQTVCYSPTQNIDKAYVERAIGCICNSTTKTTFCALDSQGLLVYLECANGQWRSGSVGNCSTDALACVSPTQNLDYAQVFGAVGCACDPAKDSTSCGTSPLGKSVELACVNSKWVFQNSPCIN